VEKEAAISIGSHADKFVRYTHPVELANSSIDIIDRKRKVTQAASLGIRRPGRRIGESEELDEIIPIEREFSHHGSPLRAILLAENTAPQNSAIEAQGCLIIRTNNGDMIYPSELKHEPKGD